MRNLLIGLKDLDRRLVVDLVCQRRKMLDRFMILLTAIGDGWIWLAAGVILLLEGETLTFYRLSVGLFMEVMAYKAIKHFYSRPRPFQRLEGVPCLLQPPDRYSFPSGHTAAAFVSAMIIGSFVSTFLSPLLILACLIGFSRVYLGVHYPSDVLGGAALGICCAELAQWFFA